MMTMMEKYSTHFWTILYMVKNINMRIRADLRMVHNEKDHLKRKAIPSIVTQKFYDNQVVKIDKIKNIIVPNNHISECVYDN